MVTQQIHVDVGAHRVTALADVTVGGTGVLHGTQVHAGNTGVIGAGLSYADLAPVGDIHLRPSWLSANQDGDRIWHGPCPEKPVAHWHFERFDVAGRISVSLDDMHVRACRIGTTGAYPLRFLGSTAFDANHVGLIAEYLEIAGPPSERHGIILAAQQPGSALIRRCHIHGQAVGAEARTGNTFLNCLVEDIHYFSGSHNTCVSTRGGASGSGVKIIGCNLDGGNSAALSCYTDQGPVQDVLIQDNLINPDIANYALRGGEDTTNGGNHEANRDIRITGNVFGRKYHRLCGSSAPHTEWNPSRPGNVWADNRWGPRGPYWQPGDPEEGDPIAG